MSVDGPGLSREEIDELRSSVAALREDLGRLGGSRDRPGEPAATGLLGRLVAALRGGLDGVDLVRLYEELRRRVAVPLSGDISAEVDEFGLDRSYLDSARGLLDFLYDRWWRVVVSGVDNVPLDGRVLFVANRSGVLPYDGLMIAHAVEREHASGERPRFLTADWLWTLPFSQPLLARVGGVRACPENAERLLASGQRVVAFPEGQKGALKPFRERYRLQRFGRGGFVSLAVRLRAALVPVSVVGAEEVHPILYRPRLMRRLIGAPLTVTPTFPLLGPLGLIPLPSQWRIRFGEARSFEQIDPSRADDPLFVNRTCEEVRGTIQALLDQEVRERRSVWSQ